MKQHKISGVNLEWLKNFGESPNQAISKIRNSLGTPKELLKGNSLGTPKELLDKTQQTINESVADLKSKFNTILIQIKKDIKTLQQNQNDIQERLNTAVNTIVKRQIESLRDDIIKEIKREVARG